MFSEILKIIPKIDAKGLADMEKALGNRFVRVAKKFGKGVVGVFKGGGIAGAALGLIDKLLNPLKEVQESIDRTLKTSGDLVSNAEQFGTTPGQLFKLRQLAKTKGLDEDGLYNLISKFQVAVADAKEDPKKPSAVRNYAGFTDMAEGFFQFIQALQGLEKSQQLLVQKEVFGEKQILKAADFFNADMAQQVKALGISDTKTISSALTRLDKLGDLEDVLGARREYTDLIGKAGVINEGVVRARDKSERLALEKENKRIQSYQDLANISDSVSKIMGLVENQLGLFGKLLGALTPALDKLIGFIDRIQKSKWAQRIFGGFMSKDKGE